MGIHHFHLYEIAVNLFYKGFWTYYLIKGHHVGINQSTSLVTGITKSVSLENLFKEC